MAEGVWDLATHERLLGMDGYRPSCCPRCGSAVHAHEHRSRLLLGEAEGSTEVVIYRCAEHESCGAVWRVLPRFLARHLWRAWSTVERTVVDREGEEPVAPGLTAGSGPPVPERTRLRWRGRLVASAAMVIATLATAMDAPEMRDVVKRAGYRATRGEVVAIFAQGNRSPPVRGQVLGRLAATLHRLAPGVRLM